MFKMTLDEAANLFFLTGFVASRLKDIPDPNIALLFSAVTIIAYLLAYILWYAATQYYPEVPPVEGVWCGFAPVKQQYQYTAILGIIACLLCLTLQPSLIVLALWTFLISNLIWSLTEAHKLYHPDLQDDPNRTEKQSLLLNFAFAMTLLCVLNVLTGSVDFWMPTFEILTYRTSVTVGNLLAGLAIFFLNQSANVELVGSEEDEGRNHRDNAGQIHQSEEDEGRDHGDNAGQIRQDDLAFPDYDRPLRQVNSTGNLSGMLSTMSTFKSNPTGQLSHDDSSFAYCR